MQDSVLTLGEKIVLAARLASIEHVRQELDAALRRKAAAAADVRALGHETTPVGDRRDGFTDESDVPALTRPVAAILKDVFGRIEAQQAPGRKGGARKVSAA